MLDRTDHAGQVAASRNQVKRSLSGVAPAPRRNAEARQDLPRPSSPAALTWRARLHEIARGLLALHGYTIPGR